MTLPKVGERYVIVDHITITIVNVDQDTGRFEAVYLSGSMLEYFTSTVDWFTDYLNRYPHYSEQ